MDRAAGRHYLSMLALHAAHVVEELLAGFRVAERLGARRFVLLNACLFAVPAGLYVGLLRDSQRACRLGRVYAGFMVFHGFQHNLLTILTRRYRHGFAGGLTGIGLVLTGIPLLRRLSAFTKTG